MCYTTVLVVSTSSSFVITNPPNLLSAVNSGSGYFSVASTGRENYQIAPLLSMASSVPLSSPYKFLNVPCSTTGRMRRSVAVRAEAVETINPAIRKEEDKVVDSVVVSELSKPLTAYCRFGF